MHTVPVIICVSRSRFWRAKSRRSTVTALACGRAVEVRGLDARSAVGSLPRPRDWSTRTPRVFARRSAGRDSLPAFAVRPAWLLRGPLSVQPAGLQSCPLLPILTGVRIGGVELTRRNDILEPSRAHAQSGVIAGVIPGVARRTISAAMAARRLFPIRSDDPTEGAPASLPDDPVSSIDGWQRVVAPAGRPTLNPDAAAVLARIIRFVRDGMRQDGSRTGGSP